MKIAILSVSEKGKELSSRLQELLEDDPTIIKTKTFHKNVKSNIDEVFDEYDAIIGIMATGILVRAICNKLNSKYSDPGILAIDENGKFVISLVSGHLGRANELSRKIAKLLNSEEVITTATDVQGKIGIDSLANSYYWKIANLKDILIFNKAILEDNTIELAITDNINYLNDLDSKNYKIIKNKIIKKEDQSQNSASDEIIAIFNNNSINLIPQKLVVGIGAKKGIHKEKVLIAIKKAMDILNLPLERIDKFATIDIKKEEKGILAAVKSLDKELKIISKAKIANFQHDDISISEFVEKKFNIPGVAEPCALIEAGENSKLICKKIAIDGVTVAIAISE